MAQRTDREHIKELQDLCEKLDALRQQAEELCKSATAQINRARKTSPIERRVKSKRVKRERRKD
jgi:hypothetical protein